MGIYDRRVLVEAWLTMQRNWWAHQAVQDQVSADPEEAWSVLLCLVAEAESDEMLETIGAGPLEDFLRAHSQKRMGEIEAEATRNEKLRRTLSHVWLPRSRDDITARLVALGCQLVGEQQ